jgi:uncharacterized membrane protein
LDFFRKHDLVLILFFGLALISLIATTDTPLPISLSALRVFLGILFATLIPGYALQAGLFPHKDEMDTAARFAISLGLSIAILPLLAFLLNAFSISINLTSVTSSITLFIVGASLFAFLRRRGSLTPINDSPFLSIHFREWWSASDSLSRLLICVAAIASATALGASLAILHEIPISDFTEFSLQNPNEEASQYLQLLKSGQVVDLVFVIHNREGNSGKYRVLARANGELTLAIAGPINISDGATGKLHLQFDTSHVKEGSVIEFLLDRSGSDFPYRTLRLWLAITPQQ